MAGERHDSLEELFAQSQLSLHVPRDASAARASPSTASRSDVYFDESLRFFCLLRLPSSLGWTQEQAQTLLSSPGVSVTAEVGYVEEEVGPLTLPRRQWANAGLGVSGASAPPLTPAPVPDISNASESYAKATPTSTVQVQASRENVKVEVEDGQLVASFEMTCDVAYPKAQLNSPMLVVTATISLRTHMLAQLLPQVEAATSTDSGDSRALAAQVRMTRRTDEEYAFAGSDEINLFSPLSSDPAFADTAPFVPSSRLPSTLLKQTYGGYDPRMHGHRASMSMSHARSRSQERVLSPEALPALRRSVRGVYPARPAISVRIRAIESGPFLCIELENNAATGQRFEVERVAVEADPFSVRAMPFLMNSVEQVNLLYKPRPVSASAEGSKATTATPIAATMSPSRSFSRRAPPAWAPSAASTSVRDVETAQSLSVVVYGRVMKADEDGELRAITSTIKSRWSSNTDINALLARSQRETVGGAVSRLSLTATKPAQRSSQPEAGPIAGSRRHTAASLASLATPRPSSLPTVVAPTPRMSSLALDSPRRPTSALAAPSFGRRFFSTPTPASPGPSIAETLETSSALTVPDTPVTPVPPTPAYPPYQTGPPAASAYFDSARPLPSPEEDDKSLIVSIALQPLSENGIIRPLDTFLVDVFMANRSDSVRRFTIGVPSRKARSHKVRDEKRRIGTASIAERMERYAAVEASRATVLPLENHVRIGPLLPKTVQSVRMRFLALRAGVHVIEELQLVEVGPGTETRLRNVLTVAVEEPLSSS